MNYVHLPANKSHTIAEKLSENLALSQPVFNILDAAIKYGYDGPEVYVSCEDESPIVLVALPCFSNHYVFFSIHWDPEFHTDGVVHKFLVSLKEMNWSHVTYYWVLANKHISAKLNEILSSPDLIGDRIRRENYDSVEFAFIGPLIQDIRISSDFSIERIKERDLPYVLSKWNYSILMKPQTFVELMRILPHYGVYTENEERPVAWLAFLPSGMINMAYTEPQYRGRGLYSSLLMKISQDLLSRNVRPVLYNDENNVMGVGLSKLNKKLGFKACSSTATISVYT